MKRVCRNCHNHTYIGNFYWQFDQLVVLYNEEFARPVQRIMDEPFEHDVQWDFWELWHHEGRRARIPNQFTGLL